MKWPSREEWAHERQKQLAQLLVEERKAHKIRQQELAHRLHWHQSAVSRLETGARRIDVCEFFNLAEAIGFDPSVALKKIQNVACNGGHVALSNSLDEALAVVKAAGYRVTKPKPPRRQGLGPTFVAEFADGQVTRMSTFTSLEKLDWDRGVRLSHAAYQTRRRARERKQRWPLSVAPVPPPAIVSARFEQDGKVLAQRMEIPTEAGARQ